MRFSTILKGLLAAIGICSLSWAAGGVRLEKIWSLSKDQQGRYLFLMPLEVVEDAQGNLLVLDKGQVHIYDRQGKFLSVLDVQEKGGCCGEPSDIALDRRGNIFLCYPNMKLVQGFDREGNRICRFSAKKGTPMQIAIDSHGNFYLNEVGPEAEDILYKYNPDGNLLAGFGGPEEPKPMAVAKDAPEDFRKIMAAQGFLGIDSKDNIYFAFRTSYVLRKYSPSGELLWEVKPKEELVLSRPKEGAYHLVGDMEVTPEGRVFVLRIAPGGKEQKADIWGSDGKLIDSFKLLERYFGFGLGRQSTIYFIENVIYRKIDKFALE